ncbi:MAG TPA: carboxylesterase family protein [Planctomycetaceae bacterium]|nr:carboxylesterase family protein [Planctomycetaceae bacterium]
MKADRYWPFPVSTNSLSRRDFLEGSCQLAAGLSASLVMPSWLHGQEKTAESRSPVVETANGRVCGAIVNGIHVFKGLPYGAPTSGPNRFMPPRKPEAWTGVRDALNFGPIAPQRNPKLNPMAALAASIYAPGKPMSIFAYPRQIREGEDCLVLDIYTPGVGNGPRRPVMVWLHGGGFAQGSASASVYDDDLKKRVKTLFGDNGQRVIDLYRKTDPSLNPYELFVLMQTDSTMAINSIRIAERKSAAGRAPAYLYNFHWKSPINGLHSPHTLEIPFVFNNIKIAKVLTGDSPDAFELANKVTDAWVAFARTGNPNTAGMPAWPTYDEKNRATMVIDNQCQIVNDPIREKRLLLVEVARPA